MDDIITAAESTVRSQSMRYCNGADIAPHPQNDRVKWWSVAQIVMLLCVCAFNVRFIRNWFEVKRVL